MIYIIGNDGTPQRVDGVGNELYPVGSIYMSTTNTSPASMFGGTWEQIKDKFLLSAGDTYSAGATGGEATHTHSLDTDTAQARLYIEDSRVAYFEFNQYNATGVRNFVNYQFAGGTGSAFQGDSSFATKLFGNTSNVSNMPPYLVVYCWKRIS